MATILSSARVWACNEFGGAKLGRVDSVGRLVNIADASFGATIARTNKGAPFAYVPIDGTSLQIRDVDGMKGTGPIGARNFPTRGFQVMSSLVVTPDGVPQGLCALSWWSRSAALRVGGREGADPGLERHPDGHAVEESVGARGDVERGGFAPPPPPPPPRSRSPRRARRPAENHPVRGGRRRLGSRG